MNIPKITTTVVFHNELEFLPGFFQNAFTYSDEIICAAHAPIDGSLEFVKELQKGYKIPIKILEFPPETVFKHGFSYMKNACIKEATGDWIVSLDADEEMDITKEYMTERHAEPFEVLHTITKQIDERLPHWTLDNREQIKQEGNWITLNHWRIFRNRRKIQWKGIIHEELRNRFGHHPAAGAFESDIIMWHYGAMGNKDKRSFKDGLYAELICRLQDNPDIREGTNPSWWTDFYDKNKEKLLSDREIYRNSIDKSWLIS